MKNYRKFSLFIILSLYPFSVNAIDKINPSVDIKYLGAFRVPIDSSSNYTWGWVNSSQGLTFNPNGDGGKGSLVSPPMVTGNTFAKVTEFTIPDPVISSTKNIQELKIAKTINDWTEITQGKFDQGQSEKRVSDMEIIPRTGTQATDKIYWLTIDWFDPPSNFPSLGMSDLDFKSPNAKGPWIISGSWAPTDNILSAKTSQYIFRVPKTWADQYAPGYDIAVGQNKPNGGGSRGACIYAVKSWDSDNPPWSPYPKGSNPPIPNEAKIDSIELLCPGMDIAKRRNYNHSLSDDFSYSDGQQDAVWVDNGTNGAIIFSGQVAHLAAADTGDCHLDKGEMCEYYKLQSPWWVNLPACTTPPCAASPDACPGHDFRGEPYYRVLWFYDINDITAVRQGKKNPWEPQPYTIFNLENFFFKKNICGGIGGITYDATKKRIFLVEDKADSTISSYDLTPIIHVFQVVDSGLPEDSIPPPKVTDVKSIQYDDRIEISWSPSIDNIGPTMYLIYRNNVAVTVTTDTSYVDKNFKYFTPPYTYRIEARDSVNNSSTIETTPIINLIKLNQ
jgi:hypothetical protein